MTTLNKKYCECGTVTILPGKIPMFLNDLDKELVKIYRKKKVKKVVKKKKR